MTTKQKKQRQARTTKAAGPLGRAMRVIGAALEPPDDAIALLKQQHEQVKALFKQIEKAKTGAQKRKFFDELASKLVGHDAIEREIFYPACERGMGMTDLLGEALVEHGVVEFSLYQADQARDGKDFPFKCQVLSEIVLHHVHEEEHDFFPKVEKALGKAKLKQLGAQMKARFEQTQAQGDFQTPLHDNLKQVLAGALKPTKRPSKRRKAA